MFGVWCLGSGGTGGVGQRAEREREGGREREGEREGGREKGGEVLTL